MDFIDKAKINTYLQGIIGYRDLDSILNLPDGYYDYEDKYIGEISSEEDLDEFFKIYNPENKWSGLKLGNYIKINTDVPNKFPSVYWMIADFNCAIDKNGKIVDCIGLIPTEHLQYHNWNGTRFSSYLDSSIHKELLELELILGSTIGYNHIVERLVTVGFKQDEKFGKTIETVNRLEKLTILSPSQVGGTRGYVGYSKYDNDAIDIDATGLENGNDEKLAIFDFGCINLKEYANNESFWLRTVYGINTSHYINTYLAAWAVDEDGLLGAKAITDLNGVRPLLCLG